MKTNHLFVPFPEEIIDSAFFDRMHAYLPGWKIPKRRPEISHQPILIDYEFSGRIPKKCGENFFPMPLICILKSETT